MNLRRLVGMLVSLTACGGDRVPLKIVTATEFRLADGDRTRASLAMTDGAPGFTLFDTQGRTKLRSALDAQGRPSVSLFSDTSDPSKPAAVIEVDEKGAHVLFHGAGNQQSYLFQKLDGTSGIVLTDSTGAHRSEIKLAPDGAIDLSLMDAAGKTVFAVRVSASGAISRPPLTNDLGLSYPRFRRG